MPDNFAFCFSVIEMICLLESAEMQGHIGLFKNQAGYCLRQAYENGNIKIEKEFREVLKGMLFDSQKV